VVIHSVLNWRRSGGEFLLDGRHYRLALADWRRTKVEDLCGQPSRIHPGPIRPKSMAAHGYRRQPEDWHLRSCGTLPCGGEGQAGFRASEILGRSSLPAWFYRPSQRWKRKRISSGFTTPLQSLNLSSVFPRIVVPFEWSPTYGVLFSTLRTNRDDAQDPWAYPSSTTPCFASNGWFRRSRSRRTFYP